MVNEINLQNCSFVEDEDIKLFLIEHINKQEENPFQFSFRVYGNVCEEEGGSIVTEYLELYSHGNIRFDGCSHVWFGDSKEAPDGYVHLCGKVWWEAHCLLMKELWELAVKVLGIEEEKQDD